MVTKGFCLPGGQDRYWRFFDGGICFADADSMTSGYYDFANGKIHEWATLPTDSALYGSSDLSVSPDGKHVIYARMDSEESDLIIVEGFR